MVLIYGSGRFVSCPGLRDYQVLLARNLLTDFRSEAWKHMKLLGEWELLLIYCSQNVKFIHPL